MMAILFLVPRSCSPFVVTWTLTWVCPLKSNHKRMIHLWWFKPNLQGYRTYCCLTKPPKHKIHNMNLRMLHLYG
jgi:hypothetical protein